MSKTSVEPLAAQHGTRSCYVQRKCRCDLCRAANRKYAAERAKLATEIAQTFERKTKFGFKTWTSADGMIFDMPQYNLCMGKNGKGCPYKCNLRKDSKGKLCGKCREGLISKVTLVPAKKARAHLKLLQKAGNGTRFISEITGIGRSRIREIIHGTAERISPETENAIFEMAVPKFFGTGPTCRKCHLQHDKGARFARLLERLPASLKELCDEWSCIYGPRPDETYGSHAGYRMVLRDLHEIGAKQQTIEEGDALKQVWVMEKQGAQEASRGRTSG